MYVPVLATISIFPMWNSTPGAYRSRDAVRLRKSQMMGLGRPGYVIIPSVILWLRSRKDTDSRSPGENAQIAGHARELADTDDRLSDLVVGGRSAGGNPDRASGGEPR